MRRFVLAWFVCALAFAPLAVSRAAEKPAKSPLPASESVALFDAIKAGDIEARLFPKDSTGGTAVVRNKTKKALSIKLPEAFAAVPVAAQFGGGAGAFPGGGLNLGAGGGGAGAGGGGTQPLGGGFNPGGGNGLNAGGGRGNNGGAFFNIDAGAERKIKVVAVCLEHGKEDPNPRIAYDVRPLESFTDKQEVVELVRMLAKGKVDQKSAQAAAWHLANGLSWDELTYKIRIRHVDGSIERLFTADEIQRGRGLANAVITMAKDAKSLLVSAKSPGEAGESPKN